jgi:Cu/Ag efflux pump CusA
LLPAQPYHSGLSVKIFGDNFSELRRIANDVVSALQSAPGTADVVSDQRPPLAQIAAKVDRAAAARFGIKVADISDLIQTGIGGIGVSQVFISERRYDVTVRFSPDTRSSPEAIGNLTLTSKLGALVPISQVAKIQSTVLMTATVATLGMLPAALATGVGSDVQRIIATVVAGGLIPATLLTLFMIPTLYYVIERYMERRTSEARSRAVVGA